jgi:hypothetical protein
MAMASHDQCVALLKDNTGAGGSHRVKRRTKTHKDTDNFAKHPN